MSLIATKSPAGSSVSIHLVQANTAATPVRYTKFEVEVLKMNVDLKPELVFSSRLDMADENHPRGTGDKLWGTVRNLGWGPAEELEFIIVDPVLNQLVAPEQRRFRVTVPSGGVADWLLPACAIDTGRFARVHAEEKERARQRMEEAALRAEFTDARIYLDRSISEADKRRYREERAAHARQDWEDSYRLCLGAGQTELPILRLGGLEVLWRCRDAQGCGLGDVSKLVVGKGKPFADELAIGPSVFVFKEDHGLYDGPASMPQLGVVFDTDLGLHTRSFPIDIHLESGERREFSLNLGTTKSAAVQVKLLMWHEDGQWPDMHHLDLQFNCPIGTPAAVVDGEKLKEGHGEIPSLHHLQELNLFEVNSTFPLIENEPR
jgi:hypothetical protein